MRFGKICLRIATLGSTLLALSGCTDDTPPSTAPPPPANIDRPDLSDAIAKRVEGKPDEAVQLLRKHNEKYPNSPDILIQLGRSLSDSGEFPLAALRLDQALSAGARKELLKDSALAYEKSGDANSAMERYSEYLKVNPDDNATWLAQARLLAQTGNNTEALNAFVKATELTTHEDCLVMAELFFEKKLLPQAEHWYKESARKEEGITPRPLLGLLRIRMASNDEENAEALILAIEKSNPKTIEGSGLSEGAAALLRKRRTSELIERGLAPETMTITQLAKALLQKPDTEVEPVVSMGPKTSPLGSTQPLGDGPEVNEPTVTEPNASSSLADAFATPVINKIEPDSLEKGRSAFVLGNYTSALLFAREAIKKNSADAEAWRLSSQAHFQLGEVKEAEMTVLEAIRHKPKNMQIHMEYLRIARETLTGPRYLSELEKAHDLFPESAEILWQLARRYHLVERMPVTAGVLYRKLIETAPEESALGQQAKMELIKIQNL